MPINAEQPGANIPAPASWTRSPSLTMSRSRKRAGSIRIHTQDEKNHHLTGPFLPQTPLGSGSFSRSASPSLSPSASFAIEQAKRSPWVRWAVDPALALKILALPLVLYANWEILSPYVHPGLDNPFAKFFLLDGYIPTSTPDNPRYQKTYWDLVFVAYYVVFFSFVRQTLAFKVSIPLARYFGLRKEAKIDRYAEQNYAFIYFMVSGAFGFYVITLLPIYWYNSPEFWKGYPFWDIMPQTKRYYLMQFAYWWQQLIVLVLGLEKPRKDYTELVIHHFVTLWLIGWSYLLNMTPIGVAVFVSMDIPDTFLAFSKMLNYMQYNTAKVYAFAAFFAVWTYFRHYLNLRILWSIWHEFELIPASARHWLPEQGVFMAPWLQWQIFTPLTILQGLNLFWYTLMIKILWRGIVAKEVDDARSDDEDDGEDDNASSKKDD